VLAQHSMQAWSVCHSEIVELHCFDVALQLFSILAAACWEQAAVYGFVCRGLVTYYSLLAIITENGFSIRYKTIGADHDEIFRYYSGGHTGLWFCFRMLKFESKIFELSTGLVIIIVTLPTLTSPIPNSDPHLAQNQLQVICFVNI
jgi:hypothetical protein